MAGSFPTLKSGNTIFYPLQDTHSFGTDVIQFLDDSEQRWRNRLMLRQFRLTFANINAYDQSLILSFFRSQFGSFDTWSITIGAATHNNLFFASDDYSITEDKPNRYTLSFDVGQTKSAAPTIPTPANSYFPQLNASGLITSLPYNVVKSYLTTEDRVQIGKKYGFKWRSNPISRFNLSLTNIKQSELDIIRDHFYSMEGRKGEFIFLDPGGNLVNYSDDFSNASWTKANVTVGGPNFDPKGGTLALTCTSTNNNGLLYTTVLPAGNASGLVLCGSVWARAAASGQKLSIGFIDSGFNVIGSTTWDLPYDVWTRISHTMMLATNSYIRLLIGGFGTWDSSAIHLFSAQCSPMIAPGPRMLTPGMDGLFAKCRYDSDDLLVVNAGPNQFSLNVPILEYK